MVSLVHSGLNYVKYFIPPAESQRNILYLIPFLIFSQRQDRGSDGATLAALKERLSENDTFMNEIRREYPGHSQLTSNSRIFLLKSQLTDLICKVIVSTAFYSTRELSLYSTLTRFISCSEKVSKVAQPILDKIFALPQLRFLLSSRIIIFTPVLLKFLHMALICFDPDDTLIDLKALKTVVNKTSQGLEFLWNLRFSLVSLGISPSIVKSVISTIYLKGIEYALSEDIIVKIIDKTRAIIVPKLNTLKNYPKVSSFIVDSINDQLLSDTIKNILRVVLMGPIQLNELFKSGNAIHLAGFRMGLDGMLASLKAKTDSSDIKKLIALHDEGRDWVYYADNPERKRKHLLAITSALNKRQITYYQAQYLRRPSISKPPI